jgi:CCR4-NOT transcription complex subunit 1
MLLSSREVSIFNCMISNLFEEYKFFPKYPEAQLKLAAVLFGNFSCFLCCLMLQLYTHIALTVPFCLIIAMLSYMFQIVYPELLAYG